MSFLKPIDTVSDPRIEHRHATLNGYSYHYLYGEPKNGFKATVFLIHGWPDLSLGWRYQIPMLLNMGFRVVAPDLMGFGGSSAPPVPPKSISLYGYKRASEDIAALAKEIGTEKIILGGHDWGGMVVWRATQWQPELITHVFAVCTPYAAPLKDWFSVEDLVKGPLPQFGYQLYLASGEAGKHVHDETTMRQFLKGQYGARGPNGEVIFLPEKGLLPENLDKVGESKLLNGKVLDYYVKEYTRNGIESTCNWYRTRRANWEDDQALLDKKTISIPTLFIQATQDSVLKPEMSKGMERYLPNLTRGEVQASHWALTQKPEEVNAIIKNWLENQGFDAEAKSSL